MSNILATEKKSGFAFSLSLWLAIHYKRPKSSQPLPSHAFTTLLCFHLFSHLIFTLKSPLLFSLKPSLLSLSVYPPSSSFSLCSLFPVALEVVVGKCRRLRSESRPRMAPSKIRSTQSPWHLTKMLLRIRLLFGTPSGAFIL